MKLKLISMLAVSAFAVSANAADEGFKISGDFATSVFVNSGKDSNTAFPATGAVDAGAAGVAAGVPGAVANPNNGDFAIDMAEINLEKTVGNSGIVLGLGFGRQFDYINNVIDSVTGTPKSSLNLTNAYFNHKFGDSGFSMKLGKFEANLGYESYNYMDNMNYTRSYAFNYLNPFYFTGVAVDYAINDMVGVGVVVANSTVSTDADENRSKVSGVNATIKPMEGLNIKLNYLMGKEGSGLGGAAINDTTRLNASVEYMLQNMWNFAVTYNNMNSEPAFGGGTDVETNAIGLYAGAKMEMWGAGIRYEMVNDDDGMLTVADNKINVITATGWYNIDQNAAVKLEFASHSADQTVYFKDDGTLDDAMSSYGLGLLYRF